MLTRLFPRLLWLPLFVSLAVSFASGQEPRAANDADDSLRVMLSLADSVELRGGTGMQLLERQPPIQRWSNAVGEGVPDAILLVWTEKKQPVVAAQLFQYGPSPWLQENQSLSTGPVTAIHGGVQFWAPKDPGIRWIDGPPRAASPAATKTKRLLQMRSIARQYSAIQKADPTSPNQLRLLPTPLYRYSRQSQGIVDGALFSFATGTDPEVLVMIEARHDEDPQISDHWKIAFAPMTIFLCEVTRKGEMVWSCDYRPPPQRSGDTFKLLTYPK